MASSCSAISILTAPFASEPSDANLPSHSPIWRKSVNCVRDVLFAFHDAPALTAGTSRGRCHSPTGCVSATLFCAFISEAGFHFQTHLYPLLHATRNLWSG